MRIAALILALALAFGAIAVYAYLVETLPNTFATAIVLTLTFTLCGHLALYATQPSARAVKMLDYPYYVLGAFGVFAAFSLDEAAHLANRIAFEQTELQSAFDQARAVCLAEAHPLLIAPEQATLAEMCATLTAQVGPLDTVAALTSLTERPTFEGLNRLDGLLEARDVPEGADLSAYASFGTLAHIQNDIETYRAELGQQNESGDYRNIVAFEAVWPLLLALAFAIKLTKTTREVSVPKPGTPPSH